MPTIEDFSKFEFKVAKIVDVQDHPNADRLYVLKIDVGDVDIEPQNILAAQQGNDIPNENILPVPKYKQIVAGIKRSYTKEQLIGKQIIVINNLEPAILRGVESNGMLLAASDDDGVAIIMPDREMKIGSRVK